MNRQVVVSSVVILGIGVVHAIVQKKPISRVVQGGMVIATLLSLFDAIDPKHLGKMSGAFAMLAATTVVMYEVPDILKAMRFI